MIQYIIRRLLIAIPTLLVISFVIFAILYFAPGDPTGSLPMTVPPEVRAQIRDSLGIGQPMHIRYYKWVVQFFVNEPLNILQHGFGITIGDTENRTRILSWATRSPVIDLIVERTPQTLWVVGLSFLLGILMAIPIGIVQAYRQYSLFDQIGTFVYIPTKIGFRWQHRGSVNDDRNPARVCDLGYFAQGQTVGHHTRREQICARRCVFIYR